MVWHKCKLLNWDFVLLGRALISKSKQLQFCKSISKSCPIISGPSLARCYLLGAGKQINHNLRLDNWYSPPEVAIIFISQSVTNILNIKIYWSVIFLQNWFVSIFLLRIYSDIRLSQNFHECHTLLYVYQRTLFSCWLYKHFIPEPEAKVNNY